MTAVQSAAKAGILRLKLYIAGDAPNSVAAVRHLRAVLARFPSHPCELEIIDVLEHPELAIQERVLVTPTMLKLSPTPDRRIIGSLKDTAALLAVLGIEELE